MKNKGLSDYSIRFTRKSLQLLAKNCDLHNPEQVKAYIARKEVSNGYKANLCLAYNKFCKYYKIEWAIPRYSREANPIKIPTKEKLEMLISSAGRVLATKLQLSMETGIRPVELCRLKVKDLDLVRKLVYPSTAKHGAPRTLKISNKLKKMLQDHINREDLNLSDEIFKGDSDNYGKHYRIMRNALAKKLQDQTLRTIRLYDFRHFFATNLYHKTRDLLLVKQQMGHKKIETTLIYTQLLNLNDDEWICKGATTKKEAMQLIEAGFEYVTEIDGTKLFRKRK